MPTCVPAILGSGAAAEKYGLVLPVQWESFVWTLVIFGLLLLKKAEEIQRAAADIAARQEAALAEAQAKAKAVLDEARAQSEDYRKRELERAKADADAFLDRAKKEIGLEENRVRDALRRELVELVLEVSSKVLERNVTAEDDRRLADRLLSEVKAKRTGAARN